MKNLMKKSIIFGVLLSLVGLNTISAEEVTSGKTETEITFEGFEIENPDPEGGETPEGNPSDFAGFSLWSIPKKLIFNKDLMKSGSTKTYSLAEHSSEKYEHPVIVGAQQGVSMYDLTDFDHNWKLKASLTELINDIDDELEGAKINWKQSFYEVSKDDSDAFSYKDASDIEGPEKAMLLAGADSIVIMNKKELSSPKGYFEAVMSEIELLVPGKQGSADFGYHGSINWDLSTDVVVEG